MTSHADVRISRMNKIKASLDKAGKKLNEDKLIAQCCMEWGCKESTVREYIKIVRLANG